VPVQPKPPSSVSTIKVATVSASSEAAAKDSLLAA
jgi:hypothetical protein